MHKGLRFDKQTMSKTSMHRILHILWGILFIYVLNFICQHSYVYLFRQTPSIEKALLVYIVPFVTLLLVILNAFFWTLYFFEMPFFDRFRVNPEPWLWKQNPAKWRKLLRDTVFVYAPQELLLAPIITRVYFFIFKVDLDISRTVGFGEIIWQFCFCIFWEDFFLYFGHRLLHTPFFYKRIHKIHHRFNITINIAVFFMHPVELLLSAILPHYTGHMILKRGMHITTFTAWSLYRTAHTNEHHSGYQFPYSPFSIFPGSVEPYYHDFHHHKNTGNYAISLHFWDTYFGTNIDFRKSAPSQA
jgi:sterol desaturase/sphingolipid hydroxylase (fatty acid hydroxylase superfamily)